MATLVVSAQQPKGVGVVYLQRPEIQNTFDTEVAAVDVVTKEEVPCLGWVATNFKELHEIVVLTVDVAADGDERIHLQAVRFGAEQLGAFPKYEKSLLLGKAALTVEVLL